MQLEVVDAARLLQVNEKTVHRWIKERSLPAHKVGEQYRFHRAELLEWATRQGVPISPELFAGDGPGLCQALEAGGVLYDVPGADRTTVLRAVVDAMQLPGEVDRDFLYHVLLAREDMGTTALGDGIAIPHVRNPIVLHLPRPTITLCFLRQGIAFDAPDGRPVHTLFTLISPTIRAHLHMLSRLAFVLRDSELKSLLERRAPAAEILSRLRRTENALPSAGRGG